MPDSTERSEQLETRILELQTGHWRDAEKAANAVGLTKPSSIKWDDFAETIAETEVKVRAEQAKLQFQQAFGGSPLVATSTEVEAIEGNSESVIETSVVEAPEVIRGTVEDTNPIYLDKVIEGSPVFSTAAYQSAGVPHCVVCGDKRRFDRFNRPVCPVLSPECPFLVIEGDAP